MKPQFPTFINPDVTMAPLTVLPPTNRFSEYTAPFILLLSCLTSLPGTLWDILTTRPRDIFFPSRWLDALFARVWGSSTFTAFSNLEEKRRLVSEASGVVIELGPGYGLSLEDYDKEAVRHVYLVEPNLDMHEGLKKNIEKFGWADKATVVGCGIEDEKGLEASGVPQQVDMIVAIQVFCTVPTPERVLPQVFQRLNRGGQLRIFEHILSHDSAARRVQQMYDWFWWFPLGGCSLCRPTDKWLVDPEYMGFGNQEGWGEVDLNKIVGESRHSCLPCVWGALTKA
ncbi:S-adenosyl-L-methionine-dependent methyltransferase [Sphaerosporella brunnea]|uniref:S-adenosyl-L-methionine-dependent methyltransferase n=1 Tax=Sphaerosporella brunnea TaxID=1250544 RepID=A0A5J5EWL3_9PEZI|nr:S-adenosyl-L-methionine-dependent methyltransferase [Sphaerosporella brunnea]